MPKFMRMSPDNPLVKKLKKASWWNNLVPYLASSKNINVQVRPRSINIYYKMYSLLQIALDKNVIICSLHYKFIPRIPKNTYVMIRPRGDSLSVPRNQKYAVVTKDLFNSKNLPLLMKEINTYVGEEKGYQSKLIYKNRNTIIDAELAFNDKDETVIRDDNNETRTRIDLLNYDKNINKIVAIELKMLLDKRLYDGEIRTQLGNYISFINRNENAIKQAYEDAKQVKIALGLMSVSSELAQIDYDRIEIEKKPLLVVGCYSQDLIDKFRDEIIKEVKDCALGVYFFGAAGGDLNRPIKRDENKVIFTQ